MDEETERKEGVLPVVEGAQLKALQVEWRLWINGS